MSYHLKNEMLFRSRKQPAVLIPHSLKYNQNSMHEPNVFVHLKVLVVCPLKGKRCNLRETKSSCCLGRDLRNFIWPGDSKTSVMIPVTAVNIALHTNLYTLVAGRDCECNCKHREIRGATRQVISLYCRLHARLPARALDLQWKAASAAVLFATLDAVDQAQAGLQTTTLWCTI